MSQFNQIVVRCELYPSEVGVSFVTIATGQPPKSYKGAQIRFEFGVFEKRKVNTTEAVLYDVSNIALPRLLVRDTNAAGNVLIDSQAAGCEVVVDTSLDISSWRDGTKQHFAFTFAAAPTAITPGTHYIVVSGPDDDVFGASSLQVIDPGTGVANAPAPGSPGYYTKPETDQKVAGLALRVGKPGDAFTLVSADGLFRCVMVLVNDAMGPRLVQNIEQINP